MNTDRVLLTRDEAIALFNHSARSLADTWTGSEHRLARLLTGTGTSGGLDPVSRERIRHHRRIVGLIISAGYHDIISDEADGIVQEAVAV